MIKLAETDNLPYQTLLWLLVSSISESERAMRCCLIIDWAPRSLSYRVCQGAIPNLAVTTKNSLSTNRCKEEAM